MVAPPLSALELPLKALGWQNGEGTVLVSYTSPAYVASRFAIPFERVRNIAGIEAIVGAAVAP